MTAIGRRTFIALAGSVAMAPLVGIPAIAAEARFAIYDSRIAASRSFATRAARTFDIAGQDDVHWRDARARLAAMAHDGATGVTSWSDWVNLRGLLAERGLRVAHETHLGNGLFAWTMRPRG